MESRICNLPPYEIAAYTSYKIIMARVNYKASQKRDALALHGLKAISLKEAIVSVVTMRNTLSIVFAPEYIRRPCEGRNRAP